MKYKAVIFDVDGLMIDTEKLHSEAHEAVIREYGKVPVTNDFGIVHIIGKSIYENSEIIRRKYNIDADAKTLEEKKHLEYLRILKHKKIAPLPGVKKLYALLKKAGIKVALGTGGTKRALPLILENIGMPDSFEVIVALEDVKRGKPTPDVYLEVAKRLGVEPKFCVVLEDSQSGVEAAKNAGMKVIAVPNSYTKHQDFSKADKIINSLSDITLEMIKTL